MRIQDIVLALMVLGAATQGRAQEPDQSGKHTYAGKVCTWGSHNNEQYVEMKYEDYSGRIDTQTAIPSVQPPFTWQMVHPDGTTVASNASNAKDALNALCGAMIAAHVQAQAAGLPNREAAFRELLLALSDNPEQP